MLHPYQFFFLQIRLNCFCNLIWTVLLDFCNHQKIVLFRLFIHTGLFCQNLQQRIGRCESCNHHLHNVQCTCSPWSWYLVIGISNTKYHFHMLTLELEIWEGRSQLLELESFRWPAEFSGNVSDWRWFNWFFYTVFFLHWYKEVNIGLVRCI